MCVAGLQALHGPVLRRDQALQGHVGAAAAPAMRAPNMAGSPAISTVLPDYFMAELEARAATEITVNVNGGLATSAEIGEAVVNSIRSFNTVNGPANILVG